MSKYTVKNVKSFMGREGHGYECSLYSDGKKVASVTDTCDGSGMIRMYFKDNNLHKPNGNSDNFVEFIHENGYAEKCTPLHAEFLEYCKEQGDDECCAMYELVDAFTLKKDMTRWCKTKVVVRLKNAKDGSYMCYKGVYTTEMKDYIVGRHGDAIEEFMNDKYGKPLLQSA